MGANGQFKNANSGVYVPQVTTSMPPKGPLQFNMVRPERKRQDTGGFQVPSSQDGRSDIPAQHPVQKARDPMRRYPKMEIDARFASPEQLRAMGKSQSIPAPTVVL